MILIPLALAEPLDTLREAGCVACHPDGGAGVGPALAGLDEGRVRRALLTPDAEIAAGYPAGLMPPAPPEKVDELVAAVLALSPPAPASPRWFGGLFLGGLLFTGGHLALSTSRVRTNLVSRLGEYCFAGVYSVVTAAGLALLVWAWTRAPYVPIWPMAAWTRWVPFVVMPVVLLMQVAGYTTPAPTVYGMSDRLGEARGIHRITRHPVNISSAIWAAAHLFPNGDVAAIGLFGSVLVLGVAGSLHIDRRRAAADPEGWATYARQTSVLPFAAILAGRNRLDLREIGAWRIIVTVLLFAGFLWLHPWLIGASPWPW